MTLYINYPIDRIGLKKKLSCQSSRHGGIEISLTFSERPSFEGSFQSCTLAV